MVDEIHDLPTTKTRKDCWCTMRYLPGGVLVAYFATSIQSGWDFPVDYDWIPA